MQDHGEPAGADPPSRPLRDVCLSLRDKVDAFLAEEPATSLLLRSAQAQLRVSLGVVDDALARYTPEQISISYNGGKDCLVLLIVILASLARHFPTRPTTDKPDAADTTATAADKHGHGHGHGRTASPPPPPPPPSFPERFQAVYIIARHAFPEVDDFVASSSAAYRLDVARYTLPMRKGLEAYLADRPAIRAVFVGTRRSDPHGEALTHFDPTDPGWPDFMRVHPVIDWHYAEIWAFIRHLGVPYCSLYDQGYTSLGGTRDTHPNPQLKKEGRNGEGFRPAYELTEDDEERLGRDR